MSSATAGSITAYERVGKPQLENEVRFRIAVNASTGKSNSSMNHDHKVGRPTRASSHATINRSIRFTAEELASLQAHVERSGKPGAVLIREAMEAYGLFAMPRRRGAKPAE